MMVIALTFHSSLQAETRICSRPSWATAAPSRLPGLAQNKSFKILSVWRAPSSFYSTKLRVTMANGAGSTEFVKMASVDVSEETYQLSPLL